MGAAKVAPRPFTVHAEQLQQRLAAACSKQAQHPGAIKCHIPRELPTHCRQAAHHVVHQEVHARARALPGAREASKAISHCVHCLEQVALEAEAVQVPGHRLLAQVDEGLQAQAARQDG